MMQVFRYDKTFDGLLCAVFDAYDLRSFPERLIGAGEPVPMFAGELHEVIVSPVKSGRVWAGIEKRLPHNVCNMLLHVWLSEQSGSDELLMRYICKVFDSPGGVYSDFSDNDILSARQLAQKVSKEALYLVQFVRFQKAGDGTFFAPVSPRYNALPLAIGHFIDRFADQRWLVYDMQRRYGYYYDLEKASEVTLLDDDNFTGGKLRENMVAEDEKLFQDMWRSYFKAMAIKERINPKLHRQHMPQRFWKYMTEKL